MYNPAADLDQPKVEERLPKHVQTIEEVERVLNPPDTTMALGVRDRAMLETVYIKGIRRMEIIGLQQRDVDYDRGTLMIRQGKGKKDRMIPIGDRALAWVARYRDEVRPELAIAGDDGTLFLTVTGQAFCDNQMTQMVRNFVPACDGHADAGERGRRSVHPGDAGVRGDQDDAGVQAGEYPGIEVYPFGYASGAAHACDTEAGG